MPTGTAQADPAPAALHAPARGSITFLGRLAARLQTAARRPVAADSVAVFRIGFGLLAVFGSLRFLARGWVDSLYLAPENHLTYAGFGWVQPLPSPWMHLHLLALAALGACIALGYRHRLAAALFTAGFAYAELIEATLYLNHYWFVTLVGLLLALLPVHHRWSLDARAGRVAPSRTAPAGVVWALRAQVAVVYVFAGLAKLNGDWLLRGEPMGLWLSDRTHLPVAGPLLDEPLVALTASWAGALFDCTVVGWLLWRRSRKWAYGAVVGFHLVTGAMFQIGIFPWVMIIAALVFFEPDWPGRLLRRVVPSACALPTAELFTAAAPKMSRFAVAALVALAAAQMVLPLRHYAYDSNVRWIEEGYYLSWRVMLTEKAGHVEFRVTDPSTGRSWTAEPELVLTGWQVEQADVRPDLIHATALLIAEHYRQAGIDGVEVRADAWVSMNGRPARRIIDPATDLAAWPRGAIPAGWILPGP